MRRTQNSLNAAFKTGDRATICSAINAMILETDNVSAFALKAGADRSMLYRTFKNNPRFDLVLRVLSAADFRLVVVDQPKIGTKPSLISKRLNGAFDTEEITQIVSAFSETLRAQRNVAMFAEKSNMNRVGLYKSFSAPRVPRLTTVLSFLNALGLRLAVNPFAGRNSRASAAVLA
jgi:DNA-binding phage protein